MNLIKVKNTNLQLFPKGVELDFIAQQRVTENNNSGLTHVMGNIYRQNVLGINRYSCIWKNDSIKSIIV